MTTNTELHAGRELDALVAEKVMRDCLHPYALREKVDPKKFTIGVDDIRKCRCGYYLHAKALPFEPKPYSTDIVAAWTVVEKLSKTLDWQAWEHHSKHIQFLFFMGLNIYHAEATTMPEAICRAALDTVQGLGK